MTRLKNFFFLFSLLLSPWAYGFWYTGNAGDVYSAEFILTGTDLVQRIQNSGLPVSDLVDPALLRAAILKTTVHSEERVYNRGYEVDAVNLPNEKKIVINRSRWRDLRKSNETRNRYLLVLHEYLYLMGINDTGFRYSAGYIDRLNIGNFSPNTYWSPINPVNFLEIRSARYPEECRYSSISFLPDQAEENFDVETSPSCPKEERRRFVVRKFSNVIPPSKGVRGLFQKYVIQIYSSSQTLLGEVAFEPEWGRCLFPDDESCRSSGKISVGGVEFEFGFLKSSERN
jgi:hypothetical protein